MQRRQWATGPKGRGLAAAIVLAAVAAFALLQAPARAQGTGSVYAVRDIAVDKQADTGRAAREQGLEEARLAAFSHLFQRLTPKRYHNRQPQLTPEQLSRLIAAVDIQREQITGTSYRAELTMNFVPARVRQLLNQRRIPYSDEPSPPLLVVPVYEWAGSQQLWEVPNPWHTAWSEQTGMNGLVTILLAEGTDEEQLMLSADQALNGDSPGLERLARTYNAGGAVVALGKFQVNPSNGKPVLEVTLTGYGAAPPGPLTRRFEGNAGGRAGMAAEQLTRTAAEAMTAELNDAWKQDNLQQSGQPQNNLTVSVPLTYIGDYATALRRIGEVSAVERAVVTRIALQQAQFRLISRADPERLGRAFERFGMRLVQQAGGWVLRIDG